jgi:hypothetical protein
VDPKAEARRRTQEQQVEWTGAKYADGPTAQVQTWVNAPPEAVWPIVADVESMPAMSAELQSVTWCEGVTGPAVGSRFVGVNRHDALGEWSTTSYVIECEPPVSFAWAVSDPVDPSATWRFTLRPADGGTELTQWMRMGPARSGLSLAIDAMPDKEEKIVFVRLREFEYAMTATLAAIKQRAEAVNTEAPSAEPANTEAPSAEPVNTEAPSAEPVNTEAPSAEPSNTEAPSAEPSNTEAPSAEPSNAEVANAELPNADAARATGPAGASGPADEAGPADQ